jgi:hypothetical protein
VRKKTFSIPLYAGPQVQSVLEKTAPGLELSRDYGWLTPLAYPIFWSLEKIERLVGNWGWAIIILTILIKLALYPLSAAGYKSMAKMKKLTPRLQQLKETFGDDRAKLHQAMAEMYKKEKINPLGGCLPILIQIPVFIALYWVLLAAVEMRGAPLDRLDYRPDGARSLVHPAGRDGHHLDPAGQAQPAADGPDAGEDHDDHAGGVHRNVHFLPRRPGALLGCQQYPVDCAAMGDQPPGHSSGNAQGLNLQVGPAAVYRTIPRQAFRALEGRPTQRGNTLISPGTCASLLAGKARMHVVAHFKSQFLVVRA